MESKQDEVVHGICFIIMHISSNSYKDETKTRNEVADSNLSKADGRDVLEPFAGSPDNKVQPNLIDLGGGINLTHDAPSVYKDAAAEVNMEASITSDDVMRAGGFGAIDDISSFLPVASDSTDFEATIRDAQSYEEPQGNICRPGLGWKEAKETE